MNIFPFAVGCQSIDNAIHDPFITIYHIYGFCGVLVPHTMGEFCLEHSTSLRLIVVYLVGIYVYMHNTGCVYHQTVMRAHEGHGPKGTVITPE